MSGSMDLKDGRGNSVILTDLSSKKALSKEEIESLVKKLERKEIDKIVGISESIEGDDIAPMSFSIFDFLGFDPFAIIAVIKLVCDHYKDPEAVMMSDVRFSIAACLYMGNIQAKALTKRAIEGRSKIEYLAQKYNMMMGSTGSGMSGETITFPRIAASFPILSIKMASKIAPKSVNLEFLSSSVPGYMRLTPFASLCSPLMGQDARIFLMEACNAHSADMAIAFEKGRQKKAKRELKYDAAQLANDQWSFVEIASSSPVPTEDSKKTMLSKLNVMSDYDNIERVVRNYRAIMGKKKIEDVEKINKQLIETQITEFITS